LHIRTFRRRKEQLLRIDSLDKKLTAAEQNLGCKKRNNAEEGHGEHRLQ